MTEDLFRVTIPKTNWDDGGADLRSRLQTWEWKWKLPAPATAVELDFRAVEFFEPWALALFTCYGLGLRHRTQVPVHAALDPQNPSNHYLQEMGIEEVLASGQSTTRWDEHTQNTGLHVIRTHQDVDRFLKSATCLRLELNEETLDALRYGMAELGRNVVQHAQSDVGGVAIAQYFPDRRHVQVAIVDAGRGVLAALGTLYPELRSHLEGLKCALLPHVSGALPSGPYASSENAGLGLFFCKEICWRGGGSFWFGSQDALVGIRDEDESARRRVYRRISPWPGTFVVMDFPAHGVMDFGSLLEVCQSLAADARQHSGPAALDFQAQVPEIDDALIVPVAGFLEDVERAGQVRDAQLRPQLGAGRTIVLDFAGARFVTQSFAHALLNDVLRLPGSLMRLVFANCTKATQQAIRTVAAYAASYRQHTDR